MWKLTEALNGTVVAQPKAAKRVVARTTGIVGIIVDEEGCSIKLDCVLRKLRELVGIDSTEVKKNESRIYPPIYTASRAQETLECRICTESSSFAQSRLVLPIVCGANAIT